MSEAVLPAYLLGLVVAGVFLRDKTLVRRMRSIAFAVFTPFYFIKAGLYVSLPALWTGLLVISVLLGLKMVTKVVGVFPLAMTGAKDDKSYHESDTTARLTRVEALTPAEDLELEAAE